MSHGRKFIIGFFLLLPILGGGMFLLRDTALGAIIVNSYQGYKLTQGLVGHWTFDGPQMIYGTASFTPATSPTANAAVPGRGDGNGFESIRGSGGLDSVDNQGLLDVSTGTGNATDGCGTFPQNEADLHYFRDFNISVPSGATITGISVSFFATSSIPTGTDNICAALSWNAGVSTSTVQAAQYVVTSPNDAYAYTKLGGKTDGWGHSWTVSELSNANFRVYLMPEAYNSTRDFFLDYLGVNVYYTLPGGVFAATSTDMSGRGNDLSITGANPGIGQVGQGLAVDRLAADIHPLSDADFDFERTSPFSISGWFYRNTNDTTDDIVNKYDTTTNVGYELGACAQYNCLYLLLSNSSQFIQVVTPDNIAEPKSWHHFVATYDGSSQAAGVKIYVDGASQSLAVNYDDLTSGTILNDVPFGVGSSNYDASQNYDFYEMDGKIDEVRVYNRVLSADEAKKLYLMGASYRVNTSHRSEMTGGLAGYWTFDGKDVDLNQSSAEIRDASGGGSHGNWQNHATTTVIGKIGQALRFDGVDDYISVASGGGSPTAPIYVQEAETSVWNTSASPKTTASFDVLAGDILVAYALTENESGSLGTPSGGSLSWTPQQTIDVSGYAQAGIWTAVVDSNKSMTVSFTCTSCGMFGGNVLTFRSSDGVGASNKTNVSSGAPTLNLTTTQANSAVVVANGDWNAVDGSSRTWRTNAGSLSETTYAFASSNYTAYGGYHADAGAIGTYAVGFSAPGAQKYSIVAQEVKGTTGGGGGNLNGIKSLSFWAKPNSTTQSIIDMDGTKNVDISSGTVRGNNFASPTIYVDGVQTTSFPDTNWHHVVVTTGTGVDATALTLGKVSSTYYAGLLDDVRMYSSTLTADEVKRLYAMGSSLQLNKTPRQRSTDGLVGYWTFDGKDVDWSTGRVNDVSGQGNYAGMVGGISTTTGPTPGKIGQGLFFDGVDDKLVIGNPSALQITGSLTLSVWVKPSMLRGQQSNGRIFGKSTGSSFTYGLELSGCSWVDHFLFFVSSDGSATAQRCDNAVLATSTWTHVASVYNATNQTIDMYINGSLSNGEISGTVPTSLLNNSNVVTMGRRDGAGNIYPGVIDEVRVYNRPLSAEEINQLYLMGK